MMTQISRNDKCHCGSDKKYKKCHLHTDKEIPFAINFFKKAEEKKRALRNIGIYINYVKPVIFNNAKVWAIGNKVYSRRNSNETFHDFIQFHLQETLGFEWINEQLKLPENEQHFLVKPISNLEKFKIESLKNGIVDERGVVASKPNGWVKSLITIAFDIATLKHVGSLPDSLLSRLKIPREYQGARYEIMIASIFVRLGFKIEWLGDLKDKKHCEFIAIHIETNTKVGVEVKSRHRAGILHTPGKNKNEENYKGDVQQLINKALQKTECGAMPYFIFIEINAPYKQLEDFTQIPWVKDILNKQKTNEIFTIKNPAPWNGIYFTNFSPHYNADSDADSGQMLQSIPPFMSYQIPNKNLYPAIFNALNHYGKIPNIDID